MPKRTPAAAAKASISVTLSAPGTLSAAGRFERRHGSLWALTLRSRVCVGHSEKRRQRLIENARQPATVAGHALIIRRKAFDNRKGRLSRPHHLAEAYIFGRSPQNYAPGAPPVGGEIASVVHPRSNLRRPKGKPIGQVIEPLFCPRGEFLRTHCRWSSRLNKHRLQLSPTTALSGIGSRETNLRSRLKPKRARHAEQSQPKGYLPETRRSM